MGLESIFCILISINLNIFTMNEYIDCWFYVHELPWVSTKFQINTLRNEKVMSLQIFVSTVFVMFRSVGRF